MLEDPLPLASGHPRPLVLRRFRADADAEAFAAHVVEGGEPLRRHLPWPDATRTPDGARAWLGPYERREEGRVVAAGAWDGPALVGGGVLFRHDEAMASVELGIWVVGDAVGRGVAQAICRVLLRIARAELGAERVVWHCVTGNVASRRLAERLGFRHEGTLRGDFVLRGQRLSTDVLSLVGEELDAFR